MLTIYPPKLDLTEEGALLTSEFVIEEKKQSLWYLFPREYKDDLVTERLDAFVVGLLFLALKTGNDIYVKGSLSARLHYTINQYLIPAICLGNPSFKKIKVESEILSHENLNIKRLSATGLSCGVDSFATYITHLDEESEYKISYFTYFNAGSHGDLGGANTRGIYHERLNRIEEFANHVNIPLITVDTNLSELLQLNFQQTHSLRNISCVLHLQKIFAHYYYASAYRLDHFRINLKDTSDSDILYLFLLSTESTTFFSSVSQYSRVERTLLIAKYPLTFRYLDVCTNPRETDQFINCSVCYKCLRTQLTLDVAGCLEEYKCVFDIQKYKRVKKRYLGELLSKNNKSPLDNELIEFINTENPIPKYKSILYTMNHRFLKIKKDIKKEIKKLIFKK
ncbi:MAG: hypothetical protein RQ735_09990 [Flavobacteriaceae bacterium]|nr:hypothetical protein [Flavobacteriaceae bacterium]